MKKIIEVLQNEETNELSVSVEGPSDLIITASHSILGSVARGLGISTFQLIMSIAAAAIREEEMEDK